MQSAAPQAPAAAQLQLSAVTVNGIKRFTSDDVVRLSGLKVGQAATPQALDGAASRLATTGLFKSVTYRYTTGSGKLNAILSIEEEDAWTMPVVFDNFIWFTNEELANTVRQGVPTFDGMLPANDAVMDYVSQTLQRFVEARGIAGRVTSEGRVNIKTRTRQQLFTVTGTTNSLKMCALRLAGTAAVPEADLLKVAQAVIGTNYSRAFIDGLASGTLRHEYRRRGYWAADLAYESAKLDQGCSGVTVSLSVKEGRVYKFDRVEWSGAAAIPVAKLDAALGIKAGDVAEIVKLEAGLRAVGDSYGKIGYVMQEADYTPVLDDAAGRVTFRIAITEHQQFRMGTLTFPDLSPADAGRLSERWKLAAGEIYDASYLSRYTDANRAAFPRGMRAETAVDRTKLVVLVRFVVPR